MKKKCPKCKSKNIIDQRWLYPLSPNECNDCGLRWEPTWFSRIFLAAWCSILGLVVSTGLSKSEFFKSNLGAAAIFGYLALLFIAPVISAYVQPYKPWGGSAVTRKIVNYGCIGAMLVVMGVYYANG
jgi:hypothetical protein